MTPKKKAEIFFAQMIEAQNRWDADIELAKQCALVLVRELKRLEIDLNNIKGPVTTYWDMVERELLNINNKNETISS